MNQIPTQYRSKIPKDHGFPLGSKALTIAFLDTPQYESLVACYDYMDVFWASDYKEKLDSKNEIAVLTVEYKHLQTTLSSSNSFIESGFYEPSWNIRVVALPRIHLALARKALKEQGLNKVQKWLQETGPQTNHQNRKATLYFHLGKGELRFESTSG